MKLNSRQLPTKRVQIESLELHLRGISPQTAKAAANLLGPALVQALEGRRIGVASTKQMDMGRIVMDNKVDARNLAMQLAQRIANQITGG